MKRGSGDPAAAERSIQGAKLFDQMTEAAGLDAYRRKIDSGDVLRLVIVDDWQSTLIRSFTPLPENITRLQLEISPGPIPDIAATVLAPNPESGTDKSGAQPQDPPAIRFGIRDGSAYYANAEEEREGPDAADVKVYLESLWLYLSLAQQLGSAPGARASASALPDAQAPGAPGKTMQRIFISPGGAAPASDRDQYILWMPPEDARVAFVEFTYREVFDFYQGALYYKDMRRVAGLLLPFTTRVTDGIDDPESVHTIQIESAEFARPR
ncbi:MAG: hypothetical protein NXI24_07280 [bacterium]|nr:hypothetical protein [bacterium]